MSGGPIPVVTPVITGFVELRVLDSFEFDAVDATDHVRECVKW